MSNNTKEVDQFLQTLNHPLKAEIERVRSIILNANTQMTEHINWNAPSFCYQGVDRVMFKLHPQDTVQLIFHRGAKVKERKGFIFTDSTGLLKWIVSDRAIVTLQDMQDVEAKADTLQKVVNDWVQCG